MKTPHPSGDGPEPESHQPEDVTRAMELKIITRTPGASSIEHRPDGVYVMNFKGEVLRQGTDLYELLGLGSQVEIEAKREASRQLIEATLSHLQELRSSLQVALEGKRDLVGARARSLPSIPHALQVIRLQMILSAGDRISLQARRLILHFSSVVLPLVLSTATLTYALDVHPSVREMIESIRSLRRLMVGLTLQLDQID